MSTTLYRKYRPQTWEEMTGQNHVKVTLQHELETGQLAHAYLFCGPRGIGKTTSARLFAKALNCEKRKKGESEPCNKCAACTEFLDGRDLDVMEIDAASNTGVDNVREQIIAGARVTPVLRSHKIFIIDEVHMLSTAAFNALLKLLEEPPAHAYFILCTTESHKIPATILSRCQRFDFKKIPASELTARLRWICGEEGVRVDDEVLADVARHAEGCLRDAESLLGQVLTLDDKHITRAQAELVLPHSRHDLCVALTEHLDAGDLASALSLIQRLVDEGIAIAQFIEDMTEIVRKTMLAKFGAGMVALTLELDDALERRVTALAKAMSESDLVRLIELLLDAKEQCKRTPIAQMPLEIVAVKYIFPAAYTGTTPTPVTPQSAPSGSRAPKSDAPAKPSAPTKKSEPVQRSKETAEVISEPVTAQVAPQPVAKLSGGPIDISAIRSGWHRFLVLLQESHASLTFILKVAEPLALEGDQLTVGFKYAFHKQRIDELKIKHTVESVLTRAFGAAVRVKTDMLPEDYSAPIIEQETVADEVQFIDQLPEQVTVQTLVMEETKVIKPAVKEKGTPAQTDLLGTKGSPVKETVPAADPSALVAQLVQAFGGKIVE